MAIVAFAALFSALALGLNAALAQFGFVPADFLAGGWHQYPVISWASPLASALIPRSILDAVFNGVFLLIAGRFVERAIGPVGLGVVAVAGAYGGALARLALTPGSLIVSAGLAPTLFAVVGAYLMLYGAPHALPVPRNQPRVVQIAVLACYWIAVDLAFALVSGSVEISSSIIGPLGGLLTGVALARPLLAWQYRKA
ncbi:hypothetical protein TS85_06475 [Sphingomonas hengshuiensis]|uniref:Peptidase S54 rhomboid domain-containing protein n=1 Tax=Sphingomonas hengshuiensis TaxID=1609977 RepID=A0A7U4J761_9SPHN|nr:hypothetical protein TS85_06475 [Sphingomonas hengshuiensis]